MVFEQNDELLVIDCGVCFGQSEYGVDVEHPDFSWLHDNWSKIVGVFLTHGHEDHIGALPYLLAHGPLPLWGPPHTLRLVRQRLKEHGFDWRALDVTEAHAGGKYAVGSFVVEPIRVSHSIVEATALAVRTEAGTVVHSGDFKFDPAPSDGEPTDEARLSELGDEGVQLLLSDSTNVDSSGTAGSEAEVELALERLIKRAPKRVFVALFSSNVQRLVSLGRIARRLDRRICLLGRSLLSHVEIARDLGYLDWPRDFLLPAESLRSFPKSGVLALATGTQGEPAAAMSRLADGTNRFIDVEAEDTVIFSSRVIPGCERPVVDLMGKLLRRGAIVHSRWSAPVHTSGHANRAEQQHMIQLVRPRSFVPVHGTRHHLSRHAELAEDCGVDQVRVIENGESVVLSDGKLSLGEPVTCGITRVGYGGVALSDSVLQRRADLGRQGLISVAVCCGPDGKLRGAPHVVALGLPSERGSVDATTGDETPVSDTTLTEANLHGPNGLLSRLGRQLASEWRSLQRAAERGTTQNTANERPWITGMGFVSIQTGALELQVESFVQRWVDVELRQRPLVAVHVQRLEEKQ